MRSTIVFFFVAILGTVLSLPINSATDISSTENDESPLCDPTQRGDCSSIPNDSQSSSTDSLPVDSKSVESKLPISDKTGVGRSGVSAPNEESLDSMVAYNSDTSQSSDVNNPLLQTVAVAGDSVAFDKHDNYQQLVWDCDDLSKSDTGFCKICKDEKCWKAFEISCFPQEQQCTACQLTGSRCVNFYDTSRDEIGHTPSPSGTTQSWCDGEYEHCPILKPSPKAQPQAQPAPAFCEGWIDYKGWCPFGFKPGDTASKNV